ncbi:hypothetical protein AJ78_08108 [Emergomyces pasteurianus Ep9510]|uniref:NADH dehydrogenase [ubiquinone] 1 alpha subcomplex assembly factor 3 n=1 Tax=Emergomyces pasteurianus Ep9510 TaxID=1447872 RepID=A0A1J9P4H4_9EURO|nr:hypothetical protein AJ78_08108 [Emergomyces pasteurianus Ep9510]
MRPQTIVVRFQRSLCSPTPPLPTPLRTAITTPPAVYRHPLPRRPLPRYIATSSIPNLSCRRLFRDFSTSSSPNNHKNQPRQPQSDPHNSRNDSSRNLRRSHAGDTDADEAVGLDGDMASESTLSALNVLADVAGPSTAIDVCLPDGFQLDNGVKITNGDGCLLVDGEVFRWRPWEGDKSEGEVRRNGAMRAMINEKGQWEVSEEVWGVLKLVWPKPDLLILGLGASVYPISPETRRQINALGIRIEVQDTRNAAAQFNLLATERGVQEVAAALIPLGWKGR